MNCYAKAQREKENISKFIHKVDNFSNTTGKLTATDIDSGTTFTYGINGATSNGDGTVSKGGTYGTLTINSSTGEYTFVPNSNAINALSSNVTETFTFIIIPLFLIRLIFWYGTISKAAVRLNEKDLIAFGPLYEISIIFIQLYIFLKNIISPPKYW